MMTGYERGTMVCSCTRNMLKALVRDELGMVGWSVVEIIVHDVSMVVRKGAVTAAIQLLMYSLVLLLSKKESLYSILKRV